MAINYHRLQKGGLAAITVISGLVVTILAMLFGNLIPYTFSTVAAIGLLLTTRSCAQVFQGPAVAEHVARGGKLGSRWAAAGIGIAFLVVLFGVVFLVMFGRQFGQQMGNQTTAENAKIVIGTNDTVFYSGTATEQDARTLGNELKSIGYFQDRGVTVFLSRKKGSSVVSFVVKDGVWNNPDTVTAFQQIGGAIAPVLGSSTIEVRMIDKSQNSKKEFNAGKIMIGAKDEVYFAGSATEADAKALGDALRTAGYLEDRGVSVLLYKGDATIVSLVLKEGIWDKPSSVATYQRVAREVAPSLGGLPLELRLLNVNLETKKEVTIQ